MCVAEEACLLQEGYRCALRRSRVRPEPRQGGTTICSQYDDGVQRRGHDKDLRCEGVCSQHERRKIPIRQRGQPSGKMTSATKNGGHRADDCNDGRGRRAAVMPHGGETHGEDERAKCGSDVRPGAAWDHAGARAVGATVRRRMNGWDSSGGRAIATAAERR
jgi:hypothetical protein